ncbi:MAG: copper resistance protein NlpE [Bacteroidetes bacterium]|nr:MAG: copper resistance protein NlpE [Bacteroidota bacterium]PIE88622.1 MAG: copper resistance protein NlpE [Bacteroidota bacterium]
MKYVQLLLIAGAVFFMASCHQTTTKKEQKAASTTHLSSSEENPLEDTPQWIGTYKGVLPCADCEGIETTITLHKNLTFEKKQTYLKNGDDLIVETSGKFRWNKGQKLILLKEEKETFQYRLGENQLTFLNSEGEAVTGELAPYYILKKEKE